MWLVSALELPLPEGAEPQQGLGAAKRGRLPVRHHHHQLGVADSRLCRIDEHVVAFLFTGRQYAILVLRQVRNLCMVKGEENKKMGT